MVQTGQCPGTANLDRYDPSQHGRAVPAPAPEPQQRELCKNGYEPALRGGNALLCLFPGTFDVLAERSWNLARPPA